MGNGGVRNTTDMAGSGNVAGDIGVDSSSTGNTTGMASIGNVPATIASRAANFPPLQGLGVDVGDDTPGDDIHIDYGCGVFDFS